MKLVAGNYLVNKDFASFSEMENRYEERYQSQANKYRSFVINERSKTFNMEQEQDQIILPDLIDDYSEEVNKELVVLKAFLSK